MRSEIRRRTCWKKEIAKFPDWLIYNAMTSPKLELAHLKCEALGDGCYRIEAGVQNTGYLPTYVSKRPGAWAITRVIAEISLPEAAKLVSGSLREVGPELEGVRTSTR